MSLRFALLVPRVPQLRAGVHEGGWVSFATLEDHAQHCAWAPAMGMLTFQLQVGRCRDRSAVNTKGWASVTRDCMTVTETKKALFSAACLLVDANRSM